MTDREFAPAKVNLFLHVGAVDPRDGYHPVSSLMAFADIGDDVTCSPGPGVSLRVDGEFAGALAALDAADNLVTRAVRALLVAAGEPVRGASLTLTKRLPIAAGLGGGSSDAGAALRLVRRALRLSIDDAGLVAIAAGIGADGPACLAAYPVLGLGRGDILRSAPRLPPLHAVLINPRVACPTGAVYRGYDAAPVLGGERAPELATDFSNAASLIYFLHTCRNDLETPAAALVPAVAETLATVRAHRQARLVRLSGSGATVFALCAGADDAHALHRALIAERPNWWIPFRSSIAHFGSPSQAQPEEVLVLALRQQQSARDAV